MYVCMYVCKISNNKSFPKIPQDYMHKNRDCKHCLKQGPTLQKKNDRILIKDLISYKWKYKTKEARLILQSGIYIFLLPIFRKARLFLSLGSYQLNEVCFSNFLRTVCIRFNALQWNKCDVVSGVIISSEPVVMCGGFGNIRHIRPVSNVVLLPCRTQLIELNSTLARQQLGV